MKVVFIPYFKGNPYQKLLADSLKAEGVEVKFGKDYPIFSTLRSVADPWKPDILHIHWTHPFLLADSAWKSIIKSLTFIPEIKMLRLRGIKIVWTVHNLASHERSFGTLEIFFNRILAKFASKLIVHGDNAAKDVGIEYRVTNTNRIEVIPHGNYIDVYENKIKKAQARQKLGLDEHSVVFLYFGFIRPYKGITELIKAFSKENSETSQLLIAGKPMDLVFSEKLDLDCKKRKNIITHFKYIPDSEIQVYMNASDFVVLPFQNILTSGSVMLALSFGKPIIAPAIGPIPELLDETNNILYNPVEKNSLSNSIKTAMNLKPSKLSKMGLENLKLAKKFNWEKIAKKTYETYKSVL